MNVKELKEALAAYPDDMEVDVFTFDHHTEEMDYVTDFKIELGEIAGNKCVIIE